MQEFRIDSSQPSQISNIQAYTLKPYEKSEPVFIKKATFGSDEIKYNHPGLKNLITNYTIPTQVAILGDLYKSKVLGTKPEMDRYEGRMKPEELEDLTPENIALFFSIHMSVTNKTHHKHATDEIYRKRFVDHDLHLIPPIFNTVMADLEDPKHTNRINHLLRIIVQKNTANAESQINSRISNELGKASNDISLLKKELEQSREYIIKLETKIEELQNTHDRKSEEFEIARNRFEEIGLSRKNSREELERSKEEITKTRSKIDELAELELKDPSLKKVLENAREEYQSLLSEHEKLLVTFKELEKKYNLAARNISESEMEISKIKFELSSMTRVKKEAERDVSDLRQAIQSEALKHKQEIVDLEAKYSKTTEELVSKEKEQTNPLTLKLLELEKNNQIMLKEIERLSKIEKQYTQMVLAQSQVEEKQADLL